MIISHLPHGPTAYFSLSDVVMRHDIPDIGKNVFFYIIIYLNILYTYQISFCLLFIASLSL